MLVENNYPTTKRECLPMVLNVKTFQRYLRMNIVVFFVDHLALRYMVNKHNFSSWVASWILLLEELDYTVEYKSGCVHK